MGAAGDLPVGIIGAGGSGIVAAMALARVGVRFEVLEARDAIGGTWRYDPRPDGSACYASLVTNTSRWRTSLAGRRMPGRLWEYVAHPEMLAYLEDLARSADLDRHLETNWRVVHADRVAGQWSVRNQKGEERRYRSLVCALGVNGQPRMAEVPGRFLGEQLHSASYRTPEQFAGRDVLIIGLGTSGCEIAGDLAGQARSVRVAVRTPMWTMARRLLGIPIDWFDDPRVARILPLSVRRIALAGFCRATTGSLYRHGLPRPARRCGDDILAISDSFPRAVRRGLLRFHPGIVAVDGDEVRFDDGSSARVDVIIHATGFDLPTGFLPEAARPEPARLYRGIAHTDVEDLYFVGLIEAHRALLPIVERQAAWTAHVLKGTRRLPGRDVQRRVAAREAARQRRDFGERRPFLVDHARYMASLRREH